MTAMENSAIDAGSRKWALPAASTESTYENMPREVLRSRQPVQSISVFSRFDIVGNDWDSEAESEGIPKMEIMKIANVRMAPI